MIKKVLVLLLIYFLHLHVYAFEVVRKAEAQRTNEVIKIDGILNEKSWESAKQIGDFIQHIPYNGAEASRKSEVKILYSDDALYVGAMLYDDPKDISNLMSKRDEYKNCDYFAITLIPFNDGLNGYQFRVTPADVQVDEKVNNSSELVRLASWDAVWQSKTRIVDDGWMVEMRIPFSEIRFPKQEVQTWGLNVWRKIEHLNEWNTFNLIDADKTGVLNQSGELHGIKDVQPPLRLSFVPYLSNALQKTKEGNNWKYKAGGGMDVKLGINESFTLDMMLIPDFTEVESDDHILNLSVTETKFEEKRPFFTEGTELFNRGGIFYSKRIGKRPSEFNEVEDALDDGTYQEIKENPFEAKLINATKFSGRTNKGLGIGVFNAITDNTYATVIDQSGKEKEILTDPFTNYNMLVFDQSLKNNSYLSFFNTNVWRKNDYVANVSGTEFRFENKSNAYALTGRTIVSQKYKKEEKNKFGYQMYADFAKLKGNFRFNLVHLSISDTYNHNDMGYLDNNNRFEFRGDFKYNIYKPFWKFLRWHNTVSISRNYTYAPRVLIGSSIDFSTRATFTNNWAFSVDTYWTPWGWNDFFYLGVDGRSLDWPAWFGSSIKLSTDKRKRFSIALMYSLGKNFGEYKRSNQKHYRIGISPELRINHKVQIVYDFLYASDHYFKVVDNEDENHIYLGQGHVPTYSNTLTSNYIFNNKSSLSFRLRHYWSRADYENYYEVQQDGSVLMAPEYDEDHNVNYNAFNIDFIYSWQFAPGSELSVIWKSAIDEREDLIRTNSFTRNLRNAVKLPSSSSLSLKLLYYLDWQKLRKRK